MVHSDQPEPLQNKLTWVDGHDGVPKGGDDSSRGTAHTVKEGTTSSITYPYRQERTTQNEGPCGRGGAAVFLSDNDNLCKVGTSLSSLSAEAAAGSYFIEFQHKTMTLSQSKDGFTCI